MSATIVYSTVAYLAARLAKRKLERWIVMSLAAIVIVLISTSRLYLGVHYPSDILAGWTAAIAWVLAMHWLVASRAPPPPSPAAAPATHDNISDSKTHQEAVLDPNKPA